MFVRWDYLSDHSEPTKSYQSSKAASPGAGKLKAMWMVKFVQGVL